MKTTTQIFCFFVIFFSLNFAARAQEINDNFKIKKETVDLSMAGIPLVSLNSGYHGFAFNFSLGCYLTDKISLENNFIVQTSDYIYASGVPSKSTTFGFVPNLRYNYFLKNNWCVFGEAGIGFGSILFQPLYEDSPKYPVNKNNCGIEIYEIGIGTNYSVSYHFKVEISAIYGRAENITNNAMPKNLFNGIVPTFGLRYSL